MITQQLNPQRIPYSPQNPLLCYFVEKLCLLSAAVHAHLDVSHIPGYANDLADKISRMDLEQPFPDDLQAKTASVSHCPAYGTRLGRLLFSQRDHGHYHLQTLPLPGLNSHLIHWGVFWRFIKSWLIVIVWVLNIHQLGLQKHHCYVKFLFDFKCAVQQQTLLAVEKKSRS